MKNLLFLLAFTGWACSAYAQNTASIPATQTTPKKFSLNAMAGLTISSMYFNKNAPIIEGNTLKPAYQSGFFVGLNARESLGKRFALLLDAQYATKGYWLRTPADNIGFRFHYLDVAPQAEIKLFKNGYCSLGGYWGRRLEQETTNNASNWNTVDPDLAELAPENDFGLVAGLSYHFQRVSAQVRYQFGLTNKHALEYVDANGNSFNPVQRNQTMQIGLGFRIL